MLDPQLLHSLKGALTKAWSAETSYDPPSWTQDNPAWGQCAITACIVQDKLGGEIVGADAVLPDGQKIPHFFNKIEGRLIDLTREQFPAGTLIKAGKPVTEGGHATTRDFILSYPETKDRYDALRQKLDLK